MNSECIEWEKGKHALGYGWQWHGATKRAQFAHRVVFFECNGWWPKVVMHTCDNRSCVNPVHLHGGTQLENIQDMTRKGRARNRYTKGSTL